MKEIETEKTIKVPDAFIKAFTDGFMISLPETMINQIIGDINREFIAKKLKRQDWIMKMTG